eukprot:jgi/Botrbrau1/20544/Bobra.145_2s0093.1
MDSPMPMDTTTPPANVNATLLEDARQLLNHRLRVVVRDGRVFVGDFSCLDRQGNLVLSNARQTMSDGPPRGIVSMVADMPMGMVLVPLKQQVACHVEAMPGELEAVRQLLGRVALKD